MTALKAVGRAIHEFLLVTIMGPPTEPFDEDERALLDAIGDDLLVFDVLNLTRGSKCCERGPIWDYVRGWLRERDGRATNTTDQSEESQQ